MRFPSCFRAAAAGGIVLFCVACSTVAAASETELEKEIADFFGDPEFFDFRISPDGSSVSFSQYLGRSKRSLTTVDFVRMRRFSLEAANGEDIYAQGWVGNDRLLYAKSSLSGSQFAGLYSAKTLMSDIRRLDVLGVAKPVVPRPLHAMPHDPELCAVTDLAEVGNYRDVRYLNVVTGEYMGRVKNPGKVERFFFDTLGRVRLARARGDERGATIWLYRENDDADWRTLDLGMEVADWRFFDDGAVAYAERVDGPRVYLQLYDFAAGSYVGKPIGSELVDVTVDGFVTDPGTLGVYGIRIEEPMPRIIWFHEEIARLESQLSGVFPESLVTILGANSAVGGLFFKVESDINPGSYHSIGPSGTAVAIGLTNSRLAGYDLPRTKPIRFQNRDGQEIHGYLTLPKMAEGQRAPLVVMPHGGPHSHDKWAYDASRQFLAYKGFAVLHINYRGSSGRGKAFWDQDGFESILQRSVDDVIDGARWALSQDWADRNRAGIMGGSFGGYIAVEALAREPELFRCAIGFAGVYDWPKQLAASRRDSKSRWDWFAAESFGDLKENRERYAALSPVNRLDRIQSPILLIHGKADSVVENAQSRDLHRNLIRLGKQSELVLDNWGRHGFVDEGRRIEFFRRAYEFLATHLQEPQPGAGLAAKK